MLCGKYRCHVAWSEVLCVRAEHGQYRFFIVALAAAISSGLEKYYFTLCAAEVTRKLRILSFRAVLRQDSEFFLTRVIHCPHSPRTSTIF